jgi:anti-sigma B factor antagonist
MMLKKVDLNTATVPVRDGTVQKIEASGYLDSSTFPRLEECVNRLIDSGNYRYLFDLKDVEYISSAGLGVLMGILKRVREHDGDLKIVNVPGNIGRIFDLLGFSRIFNVYPDEADALASFGKRPDAGLPDISTSSEDTGEAEGETNL